MSYKTIKLAKEQGMAILTLNRPEKRNAMNGEMIGELSHALTALHSDNSTSVLLINGSGDHFCAGADISWMKQLGSLSPEENLADAEALANLLYQFHQFPKPIIAAAHGAILGGGMGIISVCDIVLAATNSSFGFPEVKIGLAPSTISPYVLAAIGERNARYYFLTGNRFDVHEAHRIGLVHQVTDEDALFRTSHAMAQTLLQNGPKALIAIKRLVHEVAHERISSGLSEQTAKHLADLRSTPEAIEGLKAFLEKRTPEWN